MKQSHLKNYILLFLTLATPCCAMEQETSTPLHMLKPNAYKLFVAHLTIAKEVMRQVEKAEHQGEVNLHDRRAHALPYGAPSISEHTILETPYLGTPLRIKGPWGQWEFSWSTPQGDDETMLATQEKILTNLTSRQNHPTQIVHVRYAHPGEPGYQHLDKPRITHLGTRYIYHGEPGYKNLEPESAPLSATLIQSRENLGRKWGETYYRSTKHQITAIHDIPLPKYTEEKPQTEEEARREWQEFRAHYNREHNIPEPIMTLADPETIYELD